MRLLAAPLALGLVVLSGGGAAVAGVADDDSHDFARPAVTEKAPERALVIDTGDLEAVVKRGALRVLVFGDDEPFLPRDGVASSSTDVELASALAESLHVGTELIRVQRFDDLIPMLLEGKGDVIAARLTDTAARRKRIAFSRPTAVVDELVIGKRGTASTPNDARSARVTVRASSSYRESLDERGMPTIDAPEAQDEIDIVRDVAAGKAALTVCDSDIFANIAPLVPEVEALFALREGRQIAFGLRPTSVKLKAAADAFLIQHAMTAHRRDTSTGDFAEMKKRGSIRVLLRNDATNYFLYRGVQQGFEYELMKQFAKENGLRIDVVVPPDAKDVIPWLLEGRADVAATAMTATDARRAQVAFTDPYMFVDEVVVQKADDAPLKTLDDLKGRTLHVRKSSSYRATLDALQAAHGPFDVVDAPEDVETEALVARVAAGALPMTVADSTIATTETSAHRGAKATLVLQAHQPIAFGVRPANSEMVKALNAFVKKRAHGGDFERLKRKYFAARSGYDAGHVDVRVTGKLSPFDGAIKKWSHSYGLDWRLMAAQAYQESAFDPQAESWCGALGLFQVMPHTGRELGFPDVHKPEQNIHAGVMYMAQLIDSWDAKLPFKQRVRFALASYNAGHGHVEDARALAADMGLDPDKWFGNVEKAMLLLEDTKVAKKTKHGWCRGSEPVKYVSDIQSRYDNWTAVLADETVPAR